MSTYAGPPVHRAARPRPRSAPAVTVRTWANLVTLVRTVLAVALGSAGVGAHDERLLVVAYAVYWVGDMADGWLARRLGQETRVGAVFDIVGDRACTVLLCAGLGRRAAAGRLVGLVFLVSSPPSSTPCCLCRSSTGLVGPTTSTPSTTVWGAQLVTRGEGSEHRRSGRRPGPRLARRGPRRRVGGSRREDVVGGRSDPDPPVTVVLTSLAALGFGLVSALVPVVNAEAYAVTAGAVHPAGLVLVVIALAVGQTAGRW